ncbi:MAG: oligosaccharide flippase family protein [Candidatus Paceibacterota bacterium]|jgi:O-antigen/teichoic acid export membrane protein
MSTEKLKNKAITFLRWTEKYTKTNMVYVATGGFWLTLAKVISTLSALATSIAFANLLSPETYGIYRYVLSLLVVLTIPTLSGMDVAVTRSVAQGNEGAFMPAFWTKIKWGTLSGIASLVVASYYYLQGDFNLVISFLIASVFLPFMDPLLLYSAYLSGKKDFATSTKYQIITNVIAGVAMVIVVLLSKNIFLIIFTYFAVYSLLRLIFLILTTKKIEGYPQKDPSTISYGKHISLMNVLSIISTSLDKILIFNYINATALAGYYIALAPFKQVQGIISSVNTLAFPNFSKNDIQTLKKTLPQKIIKSYIPILVIIIVYIAISPYAFKLVYPKYTDYIILSDIFILQLLFNPTSFLYTALMALGKQRHMYIYSTFYSVVRILLLLILVPLFGMYGAAWTILITGVLSTSVLIYMFYRL